VKLIVQLVYLLMQVVIVLLCNCQLLLKLDLSSSQNIFLVPGFISLVEHMDQHALTVPVGCSQPLDLLPNHLIPMDGLVPL
jgi:hypothetical protein